MRSTTKAAGRIIVLFNICVPAMASVLSAVYV